MAADSQGNDLSSVLLPVTGFLAIAVEGQSGAAPLAAADGASRTLTLTGLTKVGLITEDGGFEWTLEADGDPITFWQDGYSIPSGMAKATLKAKFAEHNETTRLLTTGKNPDANGYYTVDAGGHALTFFLFTEEMFKGGRIRRRQAFASVASVKEDRSKRGEVLGIEVEFSVMRRAEFNNEHLGEWWLAALSSSAAAPTISGATPSGAAAGATVTITGTGFTGATQVQFGSTNATSFQVVSDAQITAVMPAGTAGSAQIKVTTANGSATLAYTRG